MTMGEVEEVGLHLSLAEGRCGCNPPGMWLLLLLLLFEITNVDSSDVGLSYSIALHSNGGGWEEERRRRSEEKNREGRNLT